MTFSGIFAIAAISLAVAFWAYGFYVRARAKQADKVAEYREDFFDAANILISEEDTPESVVEFVHFLSHEVGRPFAAYTIARALVSGTVRKEAVAQSPKAAEFFGAVNHLRKPLDAQFGKAVGAALLAITYNDVVLGSLIRRVAAYSVRKCNRNDFTGAGDASRLLAGSNHLRGDRKWAHA